MCDDYLLICRADLMVNGTVSAQPNGEMTLDWRHSSLVIGRNYTDISSASETLMVVIR